MERELLDIPYDKVFVVDSNEELCHATGSEVLIDGTWWNEFVDRNGDLHYGN